MTLRPKKSLGQHFLNSQHVLQQMIGAAEIKKGEAVLEIGPGTGTLTKALLEAGANVIAVEKDERAEKLLADKFVGQISSGDLRIIHRDILATEAGNFGLENGKYVVVANIPYYITGAILQKFLESGPRPDRMVLLVQKEVADRIIAHTNKESILSISVKAFGTPRKIAHVPRGAFTPAPTVDSAILSITNISDKRFKDAKIDVPGFFEIVRAGFAHKRKFLIRNLEDVSGREKLLEAWKKLKLNEKARAEDLTLGEWFSLVSGIKK